MKKEFIVGSRAFFSDMPMFHSDNIDIVIFTDTPNGFMHYRQSSMSGRSTIEWVIKPKDEFIEYAMRDLANGLEFGKFLVPDVVEYLGITMGDLVKLHGHFENKIEAYQELIYNAYITNGAFRLTDEQRDAAYKAYKEARPEEYRDDADNDIAE